LAEHEFIDGFDRGDCRISFGDNVRVKTSDVTKQAGIAGVVGAIFGETTPSKTGVFVVGTPTRDFALFVQPEDNANGFWIDPDQLEFIDHGAGHVFHLGGPVNKQWVRTEDGGWREFKPSLLERIMKLFQKRR